MRSQRRITVDLERRVVIIEQRHQTHIDFDGPFTDDDGNRYFHLNRSKVICGRCGGTARSDERKRMRDEWCRALEEFAVDGEHDGTEIRFIEEPGYVRYDPCGELTLAADERCTWCDAQIADVLEDAVAAGAVEVVALADALQSAVQSAVRDAIRE